ncbi:MAG: aminoacetone oxidase family FAD-binding enzyme, partial [Candidatus Nealsonbacteria bacterium]|nr:aminoacetone oxidase family FAD-binding enzyme [Candidatus Nealsonbacteria bacterium]
ITRADFNPLELVKKYGREGDFLLSPLTAFSVEKTVEFFEKRGLKIKVERGKRIFPETDKAMDVLKILSGYLKKSGVEVITNAAVREIVKKGNKIEKIILTNGREITAKNYIIATGGKSYPATGSTGEGYKWAETLGHKIEKLRPALVPLRIKEDWPKKAQGLSLKNIELTVYQGGKKKDSRFGELLFTHSGISGPIVLDLSNNIGLLLEKGEVELILDLKPALDFQTLDKRIQGDFLKYGTKFFKNSLADLLPQKLIPIVIKLSEISPLKKVNEITREERQKLAKLLKGLKMTVLSLMGYEIKS